MYKPKQEQCSRGVGGGVFSRCSVCGVEDIGHVMYKCQQEKRQVLDKYPGVVLRPLAKECGGHWTCGMPWL